ncbi:MAG: hypothetical protein GY898_23130 [Proteobacteria bacterium]|nr:hypothetical protein [Pseudomonadota bacterium]
MPEAEVLEGHYPLQAGAVDGRAQWIDMADHWPLVELGAADQAALQVSALEVRQELGAVVSHEGPERTEGKEVEPLGRLAGQVSEPVD